MTFVAKITPEQRAAIADDKRTAKTIAAEYGLALPTIYNIKNKARNRIRAEAAPPQNRAREAVEARAIREPDGFVYTPEEDGDRLKIAKELIPDGMDYQWITCSIFGQPQPQRLARFQKQGWTPVSARRHDGMFMPKGYEGPVEIDGLMLHERPLIYTLQARKHERNKAFNQVRTKERQLAGGDIPGVSLDTRHPSAVGSNRIRGEFERISVPEE